MPTSMRPSRCSASRRLTTRTPLANLRGRRHQSFTERRSGPGGTVHGVSRYNVDNFVKQPKAWACQAGEQGEAFANRLGARRPHLSRANRRALGGGTAPVDWRRNPIRVSGDRTVHKPQLLPICAGMGDVSERQWLNRSVPRPTYNPVPLTLCQPQPTAWF